MRPLDEVRALHEDVCSRGWDGGACTWPDNCEVMTALEQARAVGIESHREACASRGCMWCKELGR